MARKRTDSAAKAFVARVYMESVVSFIYCLRLDEGLWQLTTTPFSQAKMASS